MKNYFDLSACDIEYPYFPRCSHHWGFFRELTVSAPSFNDPIPAMSIVGDRGDRSLVLVHRFELVALNKKISVYGGGAHRTMPVADPHLVSDLQGILFCSFTLFIGNFAYCV